MDALRPHLGPAMGSLSRASMVASTGAWLRWNSGSFARSSYAPRSTVLSALGRESTRRSSRAPLRSTRFTSRSP
jgi:hypothetical protein